MILKKTHFRYRPSDEFIGPMVIVERHRRDLRTRQKGVKNSKCHYHGKVRGDHQSNVALSACDGLVSINIYIFNLELKYRQCLRPIITKN